MTDTASVPPATPHVAPVTAPAAGSSDNGVQLYGELPGGGFDPLNWTQDVVGAGTGEVQSLATGAAKSVASSIWGSVEPFLATALFVIFGLGLMGLGAYMIARPAVKRGTQDVETVARPVAEAAAAGAVAA